MQIKQRKELRSKQEVNSETPGSYLPKMRVEKLRQQSRTDSLSLSAFTWNHLQQRKSYITLRYERKREIAPRRNPLEYIKHFLVLDQSHDTKWLSILLLSDALDAGLPQELWLYQQIRLYKICSLLAPNTIFNPFLNYQEKCTDHIKILLVEKNTQIEMHNFLFLKHNSVLLSPNHVFFPPIFFHALFIKLFSKCSVTFHATLTYLPFSPSL